jgi:predicted regulator of Ras-like GTPase activity (Roadblock/LC7/MglB family)
MLDNEEDIYRAVMAELSNLRERVTGVRGSVVAGMDGLVLVDSSAPGHEPHDLAALAAAAFGIGRQVGLSLRQGAFMDTTIHSRNGYYAVYSAGESALLAVAGDGGLNVARLHLEARVVTTRIAELLGSVPTLQHGQSRL